MIKQAIIPLAGLGTRLLPLTSVFAKELLPINGKPGIEYILKECIDAGIKEIIFIISKKKMMIKKYFYSDTFYKNIIKKKKDPKIIKEYNIGGIIIGNPLNMDGSSGRSTQSIKDVSKNIEKNINIPVCLWDERLSTVGAFNLSSQLDVNVTKREKKIDENAAAFILQGAIDFLNN